MKRRSLWFFCGLLGCLSGHLVTAQEYTPGESLALHNGCFQCHGAGVHRAPSFRQIAQKYARRVDRDPDLVSRLADKVQYGPSHGGSLAMPAYRRLSKGDLHVLIRWILSQQ